MGIKSLPFFNFKPMKKILLPLLLLSSSLLQAQSLAFDEDFNDNKMTWILGESEQRSVKIENGHFVMEHKRETQSWNFWNRVPYFSYNKDFSIETKIRLEQSDEGNNSASYGLLWGLRDAYNLHAFSISNNGFFKIYSWADSQYVAVKPWTKHPAIKGLGQDNTLRIDGINNQLFYYINDSLVHKEPKTALYGPNIGFNIEKKIRVSADYIRVKQDLKINLVADAIQGRKKESLGAGVNTPINDIMPIVSPDGATLYFVRKNYEGNLGKEHKDDVWVSAKDKDGKWAEATNIGAPINNEEHNQLVYISPDGQTLMLGNRYRSDGKPASKGISISHKKGALWSTPEPIDIENFVNNDKQHSYAFSSNRKFLILSIAGKECYGYKDLYVSFQLDEKNYSEPINLGPVINTYLDETTPFLAADGKTLYFSSEGHVGYGSADIFVSRRLDDSWKRWSVPQNLGPEINSEHWDAYYNIPASGELAYMVSSTENLKNTDIMSIAIPKDARPEPVNMLSGKVYHALSKKPLEAEISFYNGANHKELGLARSDSTSGAYKMVLPQGKSYEALAMRKDFYAASQVIDLGSSKDYQEKNLDIYMYPIEKGITVPLSNLKFDDKTQANADTKAELDRLAQLMEQYPDMKIQLQATADKSDVATKQVDAMRNHLIAAGIKADRISKSGKSGQGNSSFKIIALGKEEVVSNNSNNQGDFHEGIDVASLKVGQNFRIQNLYFLADSSSFTPNSIRALDELANFLSKYPNLRIEVGGHTNGLPAHAYCDKLSSERAAQVAKYLISKGLSPEQISSKGYGKRLPLADNAIESGRRQNQRVEIKVLKI